MNETGQVTGAETAAQEIVEALSALMRRDGELSDHQLDEQIQKHLPEPSATDTRPVVAEPAVVHSVSVQGIRSFGPEQTLHLSEGLTIVYAGNGKGKTSLTDALELVTHGATSRQIGLPNAASEVKDTDHITHRTSDGTHDSAHPPRVTMVFERDGVTQECEWAEFSAPAERHPDVQILPRRKLRELVNAKRTERVEPLGAALGLAETSASWTAVAKALNNAAADAQHGGDEHLSVLLDEIDLEHDKEARAATLSQWAAAQSALPATLPSSPRTSPWFEMASSFEEQGSSTSEPPTPDPQVIALLSAFVEVAKPEEMCPACNQAHVPEARLAEAKAVLAAHREAREHAATRTALVSRLDHLAAEVTGWLDMASPKGPPAVEQPTEWSAALTSLRGALAQRPARDTAQWARSVAEVLEELDRIRASLAHSTSNNATIERRRALDAITTDPEGTLQALDDLAFRRGTLPTLLKRAQKRIRLLLLQRFTTSLDGLAEPINEWLSILGPAGTPSISLAPVGTSARPSLDLRLAEDAGGATPPHAAGFFSDAQLDMLGMSAHLARIERDHPGSTIVIDDPSDMLDSTARKALAGAGIRRLLDPGELPAHQVVELTHDDQLVRDLWEAHQNRKPSTVQETIEIHIDPDSQDRYSALTSRHAVETVKRAHDLMTTHWNDHQDRLWFRAALAAHTRQAAEMCAKDIDTLLGLAGLDLHPAHRIPSVSDDLGNVSTQIRATLRETMEGWCSHSRHKPARDRIDELRDVFSKEIADLLNPGAHADVILPEASASKATLERLKKVAKLLTAPAGHPRSRWTTHSPLAELLRSDESCPQCSRAA